MIAARTGRTNGTPQDLPRILRELADAVATETDMCGNTYHAAMVVHRDGEWRCTCMSFDPDYDDELGGGQDGDR